MGIRVILRRTTSFWEQNDNFLFFHRCAPAICYLLYLYDIVKIIRVTISIYYNTIICCVHKGIVIGAYYNIRILKYTHNNILYAKSLMDLSWS